MLKRASNRGQVDLAIMASCTSLRSEIFQLGLERLITIKIESRVLLHCPCNTLVNLLHDMGWNFGNVSSQSGIHEQAQAKFNLLGRRIKVSKLRWQVETLFDQQVLYRVLNGALLSPPG